MDISRTAWDSFLKCKRCFYLDRVKGLKDPGMPGWSLNIAVDELLKKEFDLLRNQKKPHPIFKKHNLNFIPFQHEKMDHWRNALTGGISYLDEDTNLKIHGGVDDIWFDLDKEELVVFNKIDLIEKDQIKKKLSIFKQEINKNAIAMSTLDKKTVSDIKSKLINYVS